MLSMMSKKLRQFWIATQQSANLSILHNVLLNSCSDRRKDCSPSLKQSWEFQDKVTYHDQLLFKSNQMIILESLKKETANKIHESHQAVVKIKQRSREILFWPVMNSQIEEAVEKCSICTKYRTENTKTSLLLHKIPQWHWSKISAILFRVRWIYTHCRLLFKIYRNCTTKRANQFCYNK